MRISPQKVTIEKNGRVTLTYDKVKFIFKIKQKIVVEIAIFADSSMRLHMRPERFFTLRADLFLKQKFLFSFFRFCISL